MFSLNYYHFEYTGTFASAGSQKCTICPVGSSCPDPLVSNSVSCLAGSFSIGGSSTCTVCPPGWECPNTDGTKNKQCQFVSTCCCCCCCCCFPSNLRRDQLNLLFHRPDRLCFVRKKK